MTLGDKAHMWFTSLAPFLVESFDQLAKKFLVHFTAMAPRPTIKQLLANIEQDKDESDHVYLERIDNLILDGEHLDDEVKVGSKWV